MKDLHMMSTSSRKELVHGFNPSLHICHASGCSAKYLATTASASYANMASWMLSGILPIQNYKCKPNSECERDGPDNAHKTHIAKSLTRSVKKFISFFADALYFAWSNIR